MLTCSAQKDTAWKAASADTKIACPALDKAIKEYQDPTKADKITKIQKDLDETIGVMVSLTRITCNSGCLV